MKKCIPIAAGIVLGLLFVMSAVMMLCNLVKMPPIPPETPAGHFFAAFGPTGYLKFVKNFELIGGLLVMIPRLRNLGLLVLGPVIVNILAFHVFIGDPKQLLDVTNKGNWMLYVIVGCALYLLWCGRRNFSRLLN